MTKKTAKKKVTPKKKSAKQTSKKVTKLEEPAINIIQTAKCQTISNKSTLTYNIGVDDKNQIYLRIFSNTGGGYFASREWISLEKIATTLSDIPVDRPITSLYLSPLYKGKSVNSSGFLLAALVKEKVLVLFKDKKRKYQFAGTDALLAKLKNKVK